VSEKNPEVIPVSYSCTTEKVGDNITLYLWTNGFGFYEVDMFMGGIGGHFAPRLLVDKVGLVVTPDKSFADENRLTGIFQLAWLCDHSKVPLIMVCTCKEVVDKYNKIAVRIGKPTRLQFYDDFDRAREIIISTFQSDEIVLGQL